MTEPAPSSPTPVNGKPHPRRGPRIATISSHFNIYRDLNEKNPDDPVTYTEQEKTLDRFVRYHERQAQIGRALLADVKARAVAAADAERIFEKVEQ